jgi:hypothetical protein
MKLQQLFLVLTVTLAQPGFASHLSQADVDALMQTCEAARKVKLAPERIAVVEQCMYEGKGDQKQCEKLHGNYGNRTTGAIRKIGKYYDLPECVKAYEAQKHYKLNPGR